MAKRCPKRLIVLGLEYGWRSGPRFLGGLFSEVVCKAFGVLTRTLFVQVLPRLGVPGRVIIVLSNAAPYDE